MNGLRIVKSTPRTSRERPIPRTVAEAGYPPDALALREACLQGELGDLDRRLPIAGDAVPTLLLDAVLVYVAQTLDPADVVRLALRPDVRARHLAALEATRTWGQRRPA